MNQLNAEVPGQTAPDPAGDAGARLGTGDGAAGVLQRELDKWRERVPPLVAALRERTEEVERLQAELAALQDAGPPRARGGVQVSAADGHAAGLAPEGARAREALIGELERELESVREARAALHGELHARSLTIAELKRDLQGWKGKWQDLVRKLDGVMGVHAADDGRAAELTAVNARLTQELAVVRKVIAELTEERDALQARNADLFETTGFANRQMEVLADDLAELRGQLKALRGEHDEALAEREALRREQAALATAHRETCAEFEALERHLQALQAAALAAGADRDAEQRRTAARLAELETERSALVAEFAVGRAALTNEVERSTARADQLEAALANADRACAAAEAARMAAEQAQARMQSDCAAAEAARELAERARSAAEEARSRAEAETLGVRAALERLEQQAAGQLARQQQLEHQLEERSALVRGLEQERIERDGQIAQIETERRELEEAQVRAARHARESADYVQQLDGRLERQKELLLSLEAELSQAQQTHAAGLRQREADIAARDAEVRSLQLQVAALQSMLQERGSAGRPAVEGAAEAAPAGASATADGVAVEPVGSDAVRAERDSRTLRILNQQLKDARARNDQLLERIRELETGALVRGEDKADDDDLTRIRGVGPRLAQHLRELGVRRYQQIAELDPQSLDDPAHALAPLKSRILRDDWIAQAASLFRY